MRPFFGYRKVGSAACVAEPGDRTLVVEAADEAAASGVSSVTEGGEVATAIS